MTATTVKPLTSVTVPDWEAAREYLAAHTSDAAHTLEELTALHDGDLHEIVLDPETRTVWWAWDNSPMDGEGWTVDQLSPADAAEMAHGPVSLVQDRMEDPQSYLYGGSPDDDQDVLDEYAAVLGLGLPAGPAEARGHIRGARALLARQDAMWQRVDAALVRALAGTGHGGKTAAAHVLDITSARVGQIIQADDARRDALTEAVREARRAN